MFQGTHRYRPKKPSTKESIGRFLKIQNHHINVDDISSITVSKFNIIVTLLKTDNSILINRERFFIDDTTNISVMTNMETYNDTSLENILFIKEQSNYINSALQAKTSTLQSG